MPSLDEQVQRFLREARELFHLHGELARLELRTGAWRLVLGIFLLGLGVAIGMLVLLAVGFALYLLLVTVLPPAGAAALVALGYLLVCLGAWFLAWRFLSGAGGLVLPRTRTLLLELLAWRDPKNDKPS